MGNTPLAELLWVSKGFACHRSHSAARFVSFKGSRDLTHLTQEKNAMHRISFVLVAVLSLPLFAQDQKAKSAPTLRSILLEQLRSTHNSEEWFVPANIAV